MKRAVSLLSLFLAVAVFSLGVLADVRGPIVILGDADFTPENGVVSGTGTPDDPYIIAGWEIVAAPGELYGVRVENTTAAFVLRGLIVRGTSSTEGAAIRVGYSTSGVIENCTLSNTVNGVHIVSSTDLTVRGCILYVSGRGLRVEGDQVEHWRHTIDSTNELNNLPIQYYYGLDGDTIEGVEASHLTVADSRNVTITGIDLANSDGIQLAFVTDSVIEGNQVYRLNPVLTQHGMTLYRSDRNVIRNNSLRNNRLAGLQLSLSNENEVRENQFISNDTGMRMVASQGNVVSGNASFACATGIYVGLGSADNLISENIIEHEFTKEGINLEEATDNRVERNAIANAEIGIVIDALATGNLIAGNTIVAGAYGISLSGSFNVIERNLLSQHTRAILCPETFQKSITRGNTLRGNVFADNQHHVYLNLDSTENRFAENVFLGRSTAFVSDSGTANVWTIDGVGNYWGDDSPVDQDADGIGDVPVTIYPSKATDDAAITAIDPATAGVGVLADLERVTVSVKRALGSAVDIEVLRADNGVARWTGFRGFPESFVESFPGILFVYEEAANRRFTMATVLFDLDIAFFGADGKIVGSTTMTANSADLYTADGPAQYAIELEAGTLDALNLGSKAELTFP